MSVGQSLFTNKLVKMVPQMVPGVDPGLVVATGATDLRRVFSAEQLPGVVASYMAGLKDAYILGIALAGMSVVVALVAVLTDRRRINQNPTGVVAA